MAVRRDALCVGLSAGDFPADNLSNFLVRETAENQFVDPCGDGGTSGHFGLHVLSERTESTFGVALKRLFQQLLVKQSLCQRSQAEKNLNER